MGSYEYYLQEHRLAVAQAASSGALEDGGGTSVGADDDDGDASTDGDVSMDDDAIRVAAAAGEDLESAIGIEEVIGFRVFLGNEQWHVRWAPHRCEDGEETSWERFAILDTPLLRSAATQFRSAAQSQVESD